jgi:hypothetical protein
MVAALTRQNEHGAREFGGRMFAEGRSAIEVAGLLEVSAKSAYQWRWAWVAGGPGLQRAVGAEP